MKKELIKLIIAIIIILLLVCHIPQRIYGFLKIKPFPNSIKPAYEYLIKKGFKNEAKLLTQVRIKFVDKIGYEHIGEFHGMTKTFFISTIYLERAYFLNKEVDEQSLILLHELTHVKQDMQMLSLPFLFSWIDYLPRKLVKIPYLCDLLEFEALIKEVSSWPKLSKKRTTWTDERVRKLYALNFHGKEILNNKWVMWDNQTIKFYSLNE